MLAYNCSPSFNWRQNLGPEEIAGFQQALGEMGYCYQFVTLSGFHSLNHSMFELATAYREQGMAAYSNLQQSRGMVGHSHPSDVGHGATLGPTKGGVIAGSEART